MLSPQDIKAGNERATMKKEERARSEVKMLITQLVNQNVKGQYKDADTILSELSKHDSVKVIGDINPNYIQRLVEARDQRLADEHERLHGAPKGVNELCGEIDSLEKEYEWDRQLAQQAQYSEGIAKIERALEMGNTEMANIIAVNHGITQEIWNGYLEAKQANKPQSPLVKNLIGG